MKKAFFALSFCFLTLNAATINIAVAANVSYAIEDLKEEFKLLHPETDVRVTLGSSGKLTAQIMNGAPYDILMSANMKYPEALYKSGDATTRPLVYAQGSLSFLTTKKLDFTKGFELLKSDEISKIAIANPKTAPYGKAAVEAMKKVGVYEDVKKKLIYGESISQTVSYTITAADIGFIAKSTLYSSKMTKYKKNINYMDVDPSFYAPINQGIVILKSAKDSSEVKAFYDFILSKKAKKIFEEFGYTTK